MFRGFVVDDNAAATGILVEALAELAGVTTVGTAHGEEAAIAWLTNPANDWDIAIVDLNLRNNGSGLRILAALAQRQPHQRVVVWTASADTLARARCRMLRCDQMFDRATEMSDLMDYCMAESSAQAMRMPANDLFPRPGPDVQAGQSAQVRFSMAPGLVVPPI